jgi:predicted GIY-YIG superfamily endonuclease
MYYLYVARNTINNKRYVGITSNFKRRISEHERSPYPFGRALRKYHRSAFEFQVTELPDKEHALELEALIIGTEEVKSDMYYNLCVGGIPSNVIEGKNPMFKTEVLEKHPALFTTENNPMNNTASKKKMIESQACRKVVIEGKEYYGVREAARKLGISRQCLAHRLKSDNFPEYTYVNVD